MAGRAMRIKNCKQAIQNLRHAIETLVIDGVKPGSETLKEYEDALARETETLTKLTLTLDPEAPVMAGTGFDVEAMRRDITKRAAREALAAFVNAATNLLSAWETLNPADKGMLDTGYPQGLPNFEEVPGLLMAWREAVENSETAKTLNTMGAK